MPDFCKWRALECYRRRNSSWCCVRNRKTQWPQLEGGNQQLLAEPVESASGNCFGKVAKQFYESGQHKCCLRYAWSSEQAKLVQIWPHIGRAVGNAGVTSDFRLQHKVYLLWKHFRTLVTNILIYFSARPTIWTPIRSLMPTSMTICHAEVTRTTYTAKAASFTSSWDQETIMQCLRLQLMPTTTRSYQARWRIRHRVTRPRLSKRVVGTNSRLQVRTIKFLSIPAILSSNIARFTRKWRSNLILLSITPTDQ